jgi:ketosteroid isomerase-like protein
MWFILRFQQVDSFGVNHMSNLSLFSAYAASFEESLTDDDWTRLETYFADDANYCPGDGSTAEGRPAVLAALKDSVDQLERKTESRDILGTPDIAEEGDRITLNFQIRYTKTGLPDLILDGVETVDYANGVIQRMEDKFANTDTYLDWRSKL